MIELVSDRLCVDIAEPGECRGARFDRTAFVTQVRLIEGGHTFCVREHPSSHVRGGGAGLCNEFGIFQGIGYEETRVGERFPKLGVGLLERRDEAEYDFRADYKATPFEVEVRTDRRSAEFVVHPADCRGYAARLAKTVTLQGSGLSIRYLLENVGSRPIRTHEYTHNFIGIDGHPIGPDYRLAFSFPVAAAQMEPDYTPRVLEFGGRDIRWRHAPEREFYCRLEGFGSGEAVSWEAMHLPSGAGMRETVTRPASMIALWGAPHVVSPEVFVEIDLRPGESMTWTRTYEFFG
ncbi:hypothetical protein [Paenibacillus sp. MSJ-34]|uniref:hypothetical protein n=1 Tax=Paenibacillus sp. MSJ-34 TaxID=2841529 RepID=UPI001C10F124|nr:hypothetical protein [Paenibacillus sp. MSJ-34]MBU5444597.1 hypothetical protein [Paenibacillus sp. MSJ-34]